MNPPDAPRPPRPPRGIGRRAFLAAAGAAGLSAGALGRAGDRGAPDRAGAAIGSTDLDLAVPFEGHTQAGITTPRPRYALFAAFDAVADDAPALADGLRAVSERARQLTGGYPTRFGSPTDGPTPDSGILGAQVRPDALTVTVGLGASLFDGRYGLAARRPAGLVAMPTFADDALVEAECHGDVLLQLCANTPETLLNALRDVMRATRGALAARWKIEGFVAADRDSGAARNLLGFKDGTSNPNPADPAAMATTVFAPDGGTFAAVRIIRNRVEFWDRVGLDEQEQLIGRQKATGAPLGGTADTDPLSFDDDPEGARTPLDAHIRLANPRTATTDPRRVLRRGFNYSRGIDEAGQLDMGLVFVSFQRELAQFVAIQERLAGEPLVDYVVPTGGGFFYLPPGAADRLDWVGSTLLA